jgi:hypothetical protein
MPLRRVALFRVAFVSAGLFALTSLVDCPTCRAADPPAAQPKVQRPRRQRPPRLPNSLIGRITDETGAPVADARVEMYPQGGGIVSFAKTQADGSYAFERVPSNAYDPSACVFASSASAASVSSTMETTTSTFRSIRPRR